MLRIIKNVDAGNLKNTIAEFFGALKNPFTYSPSQNHEVVFGFLWGLPVPVFALLIHAHATGSSFNYDSLAQIAIANPAYIFFILHPFIFATIFGVLGTMRAHREQHIQSLLRQVNIHCDELTRTNARLKELDRLKSEFLANVTHELKSPLVTALGYTDRILTGHLGDLTAKQRHGLEVSKRNLSRLRNLIDEILDFSRLESGTTRFNFQETSLNSAIKLAMENATLKIRDQQLVVSFEHESEPAFIEGDPTKLLQIVVNLLDNAIKFSPNGGRIRILVARTGDQWRLSIADQGCGIPPEKQSQLFGRFFQVDGSLARLNNGVGLGLVIVKKLVEAHRGKIWIESKVGEGSGTTVFVEVPALKNKNSEIIVDSKKEVMYVTDSTH